LSYTPAAEKPKRPGFPKHLNFRNYQLLNDFSHNTCADGTTAFTDGETQTLLHGDRRNQLDRHSDIVAWHHHLDTFRQVD